MSIDDISHSFSSLRYSVTPVFQYSITPTLQHSSSNTLIVGITQIATDIPIHNSLDLHPGCFSIICG
jgi:hypothetical protein